MRDSDTGMLYGLCQELIKVIYKTITDRILICLALVTYSTSDAH